MINRYVSKEMQMANKHILKSVQPHYLAWKCRLELLYDSISAQSEWPAPGVKCWCGCGKETHAVLCTGARGAIRAPPLEISLEGSQNKS